MPPNDDHYELVRDTGQGESSRRSWRKLQIAGLLSLAILALAALAWFLSQAAFDNTVQTPPSTEQMADADGTGAQPDSGGTGDDQTPPQEMEPVSEPTAESAPTDGALPEPTEEGSPPTGTMEPSEDGSPTIMVSAVVASETAMYEAPGAETIRTLPAGTVLTAIGRTSDELWLTVLTKDGDAGWVEAESLVSFETDKLPVLPGVEEAAPGTPDAIAAVASATPTSLSPAETMVSTPVSPPPESSEATVSPTATTEPVALPSPTQSSEASSVPATSMEPAASATPTIASEALVSSTATTEPVASATPTTTGEATVQPSATAKPAVSASPTVAGEAMLSTTEPPALSLPVTRTAEVPIPPLRSDLVAVARAAGADMLERPGGDLVQSLPGGTAMTAVARTGDERWLLVRTGPDSSGWVDAIEVIAFNLSALPVVAADAMDTIQPRSDALAEPLPSEEPSPQDGDLAPIDTPVAAESSPEDTAPLPVPAPTLTVALGTTSQSIDAGGSTTMTVSAPVTATVNTEDALLNVRYGPSTDTAIVDQAQPGDVLLASGRNEAADWVQIRALDLSCSAGWVTAEYVQLSEPIEVLPIFETDAVPSLALDAEPVTATVVTDEDRLNIRCGPSTDTAIIAKAQPGDVFPATGRDEAGTWVSVFVADLFNGAGWVSAEYVRLSEPIEQLPVVDVGEMPDANTP